MQFWRNITAFFDTSSDSPEFRRAQFRELSRQIPLMYAIVVTNMVMLSFTHLGKAPAALTIWVPSIFVVICVIRAIRMIVARNSMPSDDAIARKLRVIVWLACGLGVAISTWSLMMFGYGDIYTQGQNTFFTGISVITVMSCLRPLRHVTLALFVIVVIPTVIFLGVQDHEIFRAIALNMLLVVGGMIIVMQRSHSDFRQRVEKEIELAAQHRKLQSLNKTICRMANEDALTGLANRRSFFEQLEQQIAASASSNEPFAVGILDLDGFKPVNDIFGHSVGDRLLQEVARRLSSSLPEGALLARLGGDEFALILPAPGSDEELQKTCRKALDALVPTFVFDEGSVTVAATCGLCRFPEAGITASELYEKADLALYYLKQHERGAVTIFSDLHAEVSRQAAAVAHRLRAVENEDAFHLEYQPIVDREGHAIGFEALARWDDPVLGRVSPDVFIRAAEQAGTIGKITMPLFRKALRAARAWPEDIKLSFNLSARDVCSQKTMAALLEEIEKVGIDHGRLILEVTESAIMQDFARATVALEAVRAKGVRVALDDFGTGYSSLSYVRRLPIDRIKLDRSFTLDIECERVARDIVATMASLCHSLDLECIVEGVETVKQMQILSAAGVGGYQGYLFSRPMPEQAVAGYLAGQRARAGRLKAI